MALHRETPTTGPRGRGLSYRLTDLFVVATCCLVFAVIAGPGRHALTSEGPPIDRVAHDLGTTRADLQRAIDRHFPPLREGPPSEAQKRQVAATLDVTVEQLDTAMERYRPPLPEDDL